METNARYEVDLHVHTTASDGMLRPTEVMRRASSRGLRAVGITDHDSINGIEDAIRCSKYTDVICVPGVEITSNYESKEIHILGLFVNWRNDALCAKLSVIQAARYFRRERMVELLRKMGLPITIKDVRDISGSGLIGRMHIAKALVKAKVINNLQEAFTKKYIGNNGEAYFEREKISPCEVIDIILHASGIPILAHPGIARSNEPIDEKFILELIQWGLRGIEISYPQHSKNQIYYYSKIAEKYDLIKTGGSDFHGYEGMSLLGEFGISYEEYTRLTKDHVLKAN